MASARVSSEEPVLATAPPGRPIRLPAWFPYLLALLFALLALRGIDRKGVTETDAARHAMNGAFLFDLVRTGHLAHPIAYAREYYGHLPALSMPFHPPVFPAIEAVFFAILGVNVLAARLAVALCVWLSALLLYRLIQATLGSDLLAACVTVTTLSAWTAQYLATEVMLEFPSLVFVLAALYCLRDLRQGFSTRRALLFGILAGTALWTKQHAVFLGAIPVFCAVFSGRWRLLLRIPIWIATGMVALAVYGLVLLSAPFNHAGTNRISSSVPNFLWNMSWNAAYYGRWAQHVFWGPPVLLAGCALAAGGVAWRRGYLRKYRLALYFAWVLAVPPILMVVNVADWRYLIYLFPPIFALGYVLAGEGGIAVLGQRWGWVLPCGIAMVWFVAGLFFQPEFLHGPAEAAAYVERGTPNRILYLGEGDGNFIFAVRALDPRLQTTVIPGDKVPYKNFAPSALEEFCRFYAINWVIFEDVETTHSWSGLRTAQAPSMHLEHSIDIDSSRPRWRRGTVKIYRFLNPRDQPGGPLSLPVLKLGDNIKVPF